MLYKIVYWEQIVAFEKWAKENHISYEEVNEGNYADACPGCGDSEFWYDGHCGHCGYSLR